MCGFVAWVDRARRPIDRGVLRAMADTLSHRGPDDEGQHVEDGLGLHHKRLSIIDLEGGHQPMSDAAGDVWIVFNGEIYNYVELRAELRAEGATFRTESDTEVLLQLYLARGDAFVEHLNGMFAFVLYDRPRRRVFVARDHFGIKPLYFHATADHFLYASEIKALLAHPAVSPRLDRDRIDDYVTFQYVLDDGTLFAGIRKLLPGHCHLVDLDSGEVRERRFWEPVYDVDESLTEDDAVESLEAILKDAVRMQVRSDVPVGAYLSGGLDSSVVTALAIEHVGTPFSAFHGRFDAGRAFDESRFARDVAERYAADLVVTTPTAHDFVDQLPRIIYHMDEPAAGPGVFPQFCVSARAAQSVKVVLGGQGGDELFCGYTRYLVAYLEQALKGAIYQNHDEGEHIVSLASIVPNLPTLQQYVPLLTRFWERGLFEPMDRRYFRLIDRSEHALELFSPDFRHHYDAASVFARFQQVFNRPDTLSYINKMRNFDLVSGLPALLHVEDRASMAASLESRVPLLDYRAAEVLGRLPPRVSFGGGRLKHLLRRIAAPRLPASVQGRKDKMGFPVPLHEWTRDGAAGFCRDVLLSRACRERGLFDTAGIARLLDSEQPFSRKLWGLLCLELWFTTFIDAREGSPG